jgi:hypothetical protein
MKRRQHSALRPIFVGAETTAESSRHTYCSLEQGIWCFQERNRTIAALREAVRARFIKRRCPVKRVLFTGYLENLEFLDVTSS